MVDPVTPNLGLAVPIRGTDTGTWDVPVNGDFTIIDSMIGGVTSLALSSTPVTLATSQAQNSIIRLTGTLLANVSITVPSIYTSWTIDNQLLNSPSSFCAILVSTSGTNQIGLPPSIQDVFYDGTSLRYKNLGQVGEYWDYAANVIPTWVGASTIQPYLNCNGVAFSSATYPILTNLLGGTTTPDARGRARYALNSGTGRITTGGAGVDGNTIFAGGGSNGITLSAANIPSLNSAGSNSITVNANNSGLNLAATGGSVFTSGGATGVANASPATTNNSWVNLAAISGTNTINVTYSNGALTSLTNAAAGYVGGITMIRAA
jgi:microcystin-dependent protein